MQRNVSVETTKEGIENGRHVVKYVQEATRRRDRESTEAGGVELLDAGTGRIEDIIGFTATEDKWLTKYSNRGQMAL